MEQDIPRRATDKLRKKNATSDVVDTPMTDLPGMGKSFIVWLVMT
jgi:hypothetical protein